MTKEQFLRKWCTAYVDYKKVQSDLEAVIATEIAKVQEVKLEDAQTQPVINPIAEAYERGEKIRRKDWQTNCWIKKHSKVHSIDERDEVYKNYSIDFDFDDNPQNWEIYIEPQPEPTEQPSGQVKLDNSFDKERFESMFRAVVASGVKLDFEFCKRETTYFIQQLDAYYASKNN